MTRSWEFGLIHDDDGLQCVDRNRPLPHLCMGDLEDFLLEEDCRINYHHLDTLEVTLDKPHEPRQNGWIKLKVKAVKDGRGGLEFQVKSKNSDDWFELSEGTAAWLEYNILPRQKGLKEKIWIRFSA